MKTDESDFDLTISSREYFLKGIPVLEVLSLRMIIYSLNLRVEEKASRAVHTKQFVWLQNNWVVIERLQKINFIKCELKERRKKLQDCLENRYNPVYKLISADMFNMNWNEVA